MKNLAILCIAVSLLSGCDRLSERLGIPDPAKVLAEGKAVGGACRHAGRGLEDCYKLNPSADKASVYEGWKEMNEYMAKNQMQAVPPTLTDTPAKAAHAGKNPDQDAEQDMEHSAEADKTEAKVAEDATRKPAAH